jgi:hypothetical protein
MLVFRLDPALVRMRDDILAKIENLDLEQGNRPGRLARLLRFILFVIKRMVSGAIELVHLPPPPPPPPPPR